VRSLLAVGQCPHSAYTPVANTNPRGSLSSLRPPGQPFVATLHFSAFDRIVDEPFAPTLSEGGEEGDPN